MSLRRESQATAALFARADPQVPVDGDPTADITATRNIRAVWKSGIEFDREAWRQRLNAPPVASPSTAGPSGQ